MATSVVTMKLANPLTSVAAEDLQLAQKLFGVAAVGAGNYVTGGLPLTWVGAGGLTEYNGAVFLPQSAKTVPYSAHFESIEGSGYTYQWDQAADTLRIFEAGTELTNGAAVPAAVTGDVIAFDAYFVKG